MVARGLVSTKLDSGGRLVVSQARVPEVTTTVRAVRATFQPALVARTALSRGAQAASLTPEVAQTVLMRCEGTTDEGIAPIAEAATVALPPARPSVVGPLASLVAPVSRFDILSSVVQAVMADLSARCPLPGSVAMPNTVHQGRGGPSN